MAVFGYINVSRSIVVTRIIQRWCERLDVMELPSDVVFGSGTLVLVVAVLTSLVGTGTLVVVQAVLLPCVVELVCSVLMKFPPHVIVGLGIFATSLNVTFR